MTVREWHSNYDTLLRRVNTSRKGNVLPQVKDIILNYAMLSVINSKLDRFANVKKEGLGDSQKRLDDLRDFIKPATIDCYINGDNPNEEVFAILPYDYMHLISDESAVEYDCDGIDLSKVATTEVKVMTVPFADDNGGTPLYSNLTFTVNGLSVFSLASYTIDPIYKKDAKFILVNAILSIVNAEQTDYKVYWERYDEMFKKDNFIIVYKDSVVSSAGINYSGYNSVGTGRILSRYIYLFSTGSTSRKPNRLLPNEHLKTMLSHYYSRTKYNSPVSSIIGNRLRVFNDSTFKVSKVFIEYISTPILISIETGLVPNITNKYLINEILEKAIDVTNAYLSSQDIQFSLANSDRNIK